MLQTFSFVARSSHMKDLASVVFKNMVKSSEAHAARLYGTTDIKLYNVLGGDYRHDLVKNKMLLDIRTTAIEGKESIDVVTMVYNKNELIGSGTIQWQKNLK